MRGAAGPGNLTGPGSQTIHERLAAGISASGAGRYTAVTLPFTTFTYTDNQQAIEFTILRLAKHVLT